MKSVKFVVRGVKLILNTKGWGDGRMRDEITRG